MKKFTVQIISVLLILLFTYAGMIQLLDHGSFSKQLAVYPLVAPFAGFIAWALPAAELAVAVLLIRPRTYLPGFILSLVILLTLSAYIFYMLHSSSSMPCACQGLFKFASWPAQFNSNLLFILITFLGLLLQMLISAEANFARDPESTNNPKLLLQRSGATENL